MDWSARVIFCDDIRQESNGKFILIGIYQGTLLTQSMPLMVPMSTYIDVRDLTPGSHVCVINATYESDNETVELASLTSTIEVVDASFPSFLVGRGMTLQAETPGKLHIMLSIDGSQPKIVDTLRVSIFPHQQ